MGKALKLIHKIKGRQKYLKQKGAGFDRKDKMNQSEEVMANSQKAYSALLRPQRRLDKNFGINTVALEPNIAKKEKILTIARFDYDPGVGFDYGIRLTMANNLIKDMHLVAGDVVRFLNGSLKGKYLKIVAIIDSTHVRLEDVVNFGSSESNKIARFQLTDIKASYK